MTTNGRSYELSICAFQVWTPSGNALPHLRNVIQALEDQGGIHQRTLGRSHRNRAYFSTQIQNGDIRRQTKLTGYRSWRPVQGSGLHIFPAHCTFRVCSLEWPDSNNDRPARHQKAVLPGDEEVII